MINRSSFSKWAFVLTSTCLLLVCGLMVRADQGKSKPDRKDPIAASETKVERVIRSFGGMRGYRTEVTSEAKGSCNADDRRQVAVLAAHVFQHIDEARRALDSDDLKKAQREIEQGEKAVSAIRALLPKTMVYTKTTAPDGNVIYEDSREVQEDRVPLFEGMLSAQTLAPIVAAKHEAAKGNSNNTAGIEGIRLVNSETINTQVIADVHFIEAQLARVAKALNQNKPEEAARALAVAQVRGVEFRFRKEDTPLAQARDAMWLAKRSIEENNATQAEANLRVAKQSLRIYTQILPKERRNDVDKMIKEVNELETKLHQETPQNPSTPPERIRQGETTTQWWDRINEWFRW